MRALLLIALLACDPPPLDGPRSRPPAPVEVATAQAPELSDAWTLLGDVRPTGTAELSSQVTARVDEVLVRAGDHVESGAPLVRLDADLARARLEVAAAAVEEAEVDEKIATRQRTRLDRVSEGVVSDASVDASTGRREAAAARVRSAKARAAELRVELARHTIRAPFGGVVSRRHVDPGDGALPGTALVSLVALDTVEILVDGPAPLIGTIAVGAAVTLDGDRSGRVVGVVPALDPTTRTARLRIVPDDPAGLLPGAKVSVHIPYTRTGGTVVVPRDALVVSPAGATVVRVEDDGHSRIDVQVLAGTGSHVLLLAEGLAPGDQVVVRGNERLGPDTPIHIVNEDG